jgi:8-oxo-dGTP pyrophosphatase MutT (NUDIX family)
MMKDWSSYGLLEWEGHVVCLRKIKNGKQKLIGCPGGRRNEGEDDGLETLIRETHEETGIVIERHQITYLTQIERSIPRKKRKRSVFGHRHYYHMLFYHIQLTSSQFEQRHEKCSEGEVLVVQKCAIPTMQGYDRRHRKALSSAKVFLDCTTTA